MTCSAMPEAADEEPAGKRRRGTMWTNLLRVDCTNVSTQDAERWLQEFADVPRIVYRRLRNGMLRVVGIDAEDLLAVGRFAIIEACVTYDATRGGALRTWVGTVAHWRMGALLDKATRQDGEVVDHVWAVESQEATEVDEFEERMEYTEQLRTLALNFALMPHRTRTILLSRLEGAPSEEIAESLGISTFREQQIVARSRASLRRALYEGVSPATATPSETGTSEV